RQSDVKNSAVADTVTQAQGDPRATGVYGFDIFGPLACLAVIADDGRGHREREALAATAVLIGGGSRFGFGACRCGRATLGWRCATGVRRIGLLRRGGGWRRRVTGRRLGRSDND